jgi:hypothetical protein
LGGDLLGGSCSDERRDGEGHGDETKKQSAWGTAGSGIARWVHES